MKKTNVRALSECGIMIAFSLVLSLITLGNLPAGGSVTLASMLPIVVVSYRWGLKFGLFSAFASSLLQLTLGLSAFSYVTTWQSVLAVALLDYIVAYLVYGLSGIFRRFFENQFPAMTLGALMAGVLRYLCHVISGATVWAGLSIPDSAALLYSISYNATYMIPDTLILFIVTGYVSLLIDFKRTLPTRIKRKSASRLTATLSFTSTLALISTIIYDAITIFSALQAESGEFDITRLTLVDWTKVGIASLIGALFVCVSLILIFVHEKKISKKLNQ